MNGLGDPTPHPCDRGGSFLKPPGASLIKIHGTPARDTDCSRSHVFSAGSHGSIPPVLVSFLPPSAPKHPEHILGSSPFVQSLPCLVHPPNQKLPISLGSTPPGTTRGPRLVLPFVQYLLCLVQPPNQTNITHQFNLGSPPFVWSHHFWLPPPHQKPPI